jgi:solute carrier family 32 (vesicular inhibitory amino acid transporter)
MEAASLLGSNDEDEVLVFVVTSPDEDEALVAAAAKNYGSLDNDEIENTNEIEVVEEKGGSTTLQAIFNITSVVMGPSMLALPYALSVGGWFTLSLMAAFTCLFYVTGRMLRSCMEAVGEHNYASVARAACGAAGEYTLLVAQFGELFCTAVSFLIIFGTSMEQMLPRLTWGGYAVSADSWMILCALALLPTIWIRNMRMMSWLSAFSLLSAFLTMATVLYVGFADELLLNEPSASLLFDAEGFGVSIGILMFAFGGHGLYPLVYASLRSRRKFNTALSYSTLVYAGFYVLLAVCGYRAFGAQTNQVITLNVQGVPGYVATFAVLCIALAKYALQLHPIVDRIEHAWQRHAPASSAVVVHMRQATVRSALAGATLLIACLFPFFALVNSLVGALFSSTVCVVFPALCYARLLKLELSRARLITAYSIVALGLLLIATGTLSSMLAIFQAERS